MSQTVSQDIQEVRTNGTDIVAQDEVRIETVIIILWAAGGVLLIALLVLLVCILKNNKKTSGLCSSSSQPNVLRIIDRSHVSRDGRDNHGYLNYDEIWTWIPIVRGNEDACARSQNGPRIFTTSSSNALTQNLEPPPYSVAISTPSNHVSTAAPSGRQATTTVSSSRPPLPPVSTFSHINEVSLNVNAQNSHCNETTPSTTRTVTVTSNGNSVVNDMVSRALAKPRNSLGDANRGNQEETREENRLTTTNSSAPRQREMVQSPHVSRITIGSDRTEVVNDLQSTRYESDRTRFTRVSDQRRPVRVHSPYMPKNRASRTFTYDATEGLYSFTTEENGRRVLCDIPPSLLDEDGPPPYTPAPDYHRRGRRNHHARSGDPNRTFNARNSCYNSTSSRQYHGNGGRPHLEQRRSIRDNPTSQARDHHHPVRQAPIVSCDSDSF